MDGPDCRCPRPARGNRVCALIQSAPRTQALLSHGGRAFTCLRIRNVETGKEHETELLRMNTSDLVQLFFAWLAVSAWGATVAWKYSPAMIQSAASLLANAGGRKVGGIYFMRAGKLRFSFCISK